MASMTNSDLKDEATPDLQAIMTDIAALKRDLARLVRSMKVDVSEDVASARNAISHLGDEALHVYENVAANMAAQGERSVKAIGHQVEEQPILSLLLAFAVGFLGSRMLSR